MVGMGHTPGDLSATLEHRMYLHSGPRSYTGSVGWSDSTEFSRVGGTSNNRRPTRNSWKHHVCVTSPRASIPNPSPYDLHLALAREATFFFRVGKCRSNWRGGRTRRCEIGAVDWCA